MVDAKAVGKKQLGHGKNQVVLTQSETALPGLPGYDIGLECTCMTPFGMPVVPDE